MSEEKSSKNRKGRSIISYICFLLGIGSIWKILVKFISVLIILGQLGSVW